MREDELDWSQSNISCNIHDLNWHQNLISWSLGRGPSLQNVIKIRSWLFTRATLC